MGSTVRATTFTSHASSSASSTVAIAAGSFGDWAAGDLILAVSTIGTNKFQTLPTGWTSPSVNTTSGTSFGSVVGAYVLTSTDLSGGVSWTFSDASSVRRDVVVCAIGGIDTSSLATIPYADDNTGVMTAPTITPAAGTYAVIEGIGAKWSSVSGIQTFGIPASCTDIVQDGSAASGGTSDVSSDICYLTANDRTLDGSTSVGGGTFTTTTAPSNTITFVAALPIASTGTIAVGGVAETDTVASVTRTKSLPAGAVSESDPVSSLTRSKSSQAGVATEVDSALSMLRSKSFQPGAVAEVDAATTLLRSKKLSLGGVHEADIADALNGIKTLQVGSVSESDVASTLLRTKSLALSPTAETDVAASIGRSKQLHTGTSSESDTSNSLGLGHQLTIGGVTEVEIAGNFTFGQVHVIGGVSEADSVFSAGRSKSLSTASTAELDSSTILSRSKGVTLAGSIENDSVGFLSREKTSLVASANESDVSHALASYSTVQIGAVNEVEGSSTLPRSKRLQISVLSEIDIAKALERFKTFLIGQLQESETAAPVFSASLLAVSGIAEIDSVRRLTLSSSRAEWQKIYAELTSEQQVTAIITARQAHVSLTAVRQTTARMGH